MKPITGRFQTQHAELRKGMLTLALAAKLPFIVLGGFSLAPSLSRLVECRQRFTLNRTGKGFRFSCGWEAEAHTDIHGVYGQA